MHSKITKLLLKSKTTFTSCQGCFGDFTMIFFDIIRSMEEQFSNLKNTILLKKLLTQLHSSPRGLLPHHSSYAWKGVRRPNDSFQDDVRIVSAISRFWCYVWWKELRFGTDNLFFFSLYTSIFALTL